MFKYVKINETQYWNKDLLAKFGEGTKVVSTYAYDDNERTFCCELTPSFWLEYLGNDIVPGRDLSEEEYEEVHTLMLENHDDGHYRHCSAVSSLSPKDVIGDFETLDDVREYYQGNPW